MFAARKVSHRRAVLGSLAGLVLFAVDAVATLIRLATNPVVAERATVSAFLAMPLFLVLFLAGGALAGYLWSIRFALLRYVVIGAIAGALVWSYMTVTWPLTARPGAVAAPQTSVLNAVLIGAMGDALGTTLLFTLGAIRNLVRDHR